MIDEYVLYLALYNHPHTFSGFVYHILFIIKSFKPHYKIGNKIQKIIPSLCQIEGRAITLGLTPLESEKASYNRLMSNV